MLRYSKHYLIIFLSLAPLASFCFSIKGQFKGVDSCYYPKVYLATINDIDNLTSISSRFVIAEADINADGSFIIEGDFLPKEKRFYRIYVTKKEDENAYLSMGKFENFALLILNNQSKVNISCTTICDAYPSFIIQGIYEANSLNTLSNQQKADARRFMETSTDKKRELLINKADRDYMQFADTNKQILPALLAVLNTNIFVKFKSNEEFYRSFLKRMQKEIPNSPYTKQYEKKISKLANQLSPNAANKGSNFLWLVIILAILLVASIGYNVYLFSKQKQVKETTDNDLDYHALLTIKEKQIVALIAEGLSNKEIAEKLNVELSTVKSHVSNIFQKTNISNRNQISKIALKLR